MPGYERYHTMSREVTNAFKSGALSVAWKENGKALEYELNGKRYRYDIATQKLTELGAASEQTPRGPTTGRRGQRSEGTEGSARPARGRQYTSARSPDGKLKAFYRDHNLWLSSTNGTNETALTTDGSAQSRIKYGSASWVYGEELFQNTAMWWSTNSKLLAYYRFADGYYRDPDGKKSATVERLKQSLRTLRKLH